MSKFVPDDAAIDSLLRRAGQQHGERYKEIDRAVRAQSADLSVEAIREELDRRLASAGLPELTNMDDWANAIFKREDFTIRVNVS